MLFKPWHIPQIRAGRKTATRRLWARPRVKVGSVYPCRTHLYQPAAEVDLRVMVDMVFQQRLGDMSDADAEEEGGWCDEAGAFHPYTRATFEAAWPANTGKEWDGELTPYVVIFSKYVEPQKSLLYFEK